MTFFNWCILISGLGIIVLSLAAFNYKKDWSIFPGLFGAACLIVAIFCWIILAFAHNDETVDRNYCASLIERGHKTQFFRYNVFNHDCYILVDGQWIVIDDVDMGRRDR